MKTVLVPINFSENTFTTLSYAVELATRMKARLILLHVFWKKVYSFETPNEIKKKEGSLRLECMQKLEEWRQSPVFAGTSLKVECVVRNGFVANEIVTVVRELNVDLVVMGTKCSDIVEEAILMTNTTEVIEKTSCPILVVPKGIIKKDIKKIASAIDHYDSDLLHAIEITGLAKLFDADFTLLQVLQEEEAYATVEDDWLGQLHTKVHKHTFYEKMHTEVLEGNNFIQTINEYVKEAGTDILVMATRKRNSLGHIVERGFTKLMTCHTRVPLLIFRAFDIPNMYQ
ncbi:MAG: universal stress protein [Bacteroidota bacterium]